MYPSGAGAELLDGTLKLRYCTTLFTTRFLPWSLPRVGNGSDKRQFGSPGHLTGPGGRWGKTGPAYQEDTSRCFFT